MWILYILGYLLFAIITTIAVKVIDDLYFVVDFDNETPFVIGIFWIFTLPFMILFGIGFGLYCLTECLVDVIEEKLRSKDEDNDNDWEEGIYDPRRKY